MMQLILIIGSTLGGFVITWTDVASTYWIDVISYFVVIGFLIVPPFLSGLDGVAHVQDRGILALLKTHA